MWDVTTDTCINFHGCLDWPLRKLGPARVIIFLVQLFRLIRLMGTSIYLCGLAFKFNPSLLKYYHCSLNSNFIFPKNKVLVIHLGMQGDLVILCFDIQRDMHSGYNDQMSVLPWLFASLPKNNIFNSVVWWGKHSIVRIWLLHTLR